MKLYGNLNNKEISDTITAIKQFLMKNCSEEKRYLAFRLALEEIMLSYQEKLGETQKFIIRLRKTNAEIKCDFSVCGAAMDPNVSDNEIISELIRTTGISIPVWYYKKGWNHVVLTISLYSTTIKNLKFAWTYLRNSRKNLFFALATQLFNVLLNIVIPIVSAKLIVAYTESVIGQIFQMIIILVLLDVLTDVMNYFFRTRYNMVYTRFVSELEYDLTRSILAITNSCLQDKGSGLFIQRLTADTESLVTGFNTLVNLFVQIVRYIGVLISMLIISPLVFAVVVILLVVQILIEVLRIKRLKKDDRLFRHAKERYSGFVSEMIRGVADIKMLNSDKAFQSEIKKRINDANAGQMNMTMRTFKYKICLWSVMDINKLIILCLLGYLLMKDQITPAMAVVLFNYNTIFVDGTTMQILAQLLEILTSFDLSVERICSILNSPEFPKDRFGNKHLDSIRGEIKFEHVYFRYEADDIKHHNREILKDMNFVIPAGSTVAIVGKSGCGKSTIFRLICKLNECATGTVRLDGTDVRELDKESLRGNIAVVSQNSYVFNLTIRENLRIVKPDLTEEELHEVCRIACIADDIERMPQGYDSVIGEGGVNLSGGQRQRIAIARCLLRNSSIMLLDEATSALDNITQEQIMKGISEARRGQTLVMIAHRLSTVKNADMILFVEEGKVRDKGTHQELLSKCSSYKELYETENILNQNN